MTVLIADDFSPIRDSLRRMLSAIQGIDLIAEASDGDQTQEMIKALKPNALILDIRMPGKTGLDILRDYTGTAPTLPRTGCRPRSGQNDGVRSSP